MRYLCKHLSKIALTIGWAFLISSKILLVQPAFSSDSSDSPDTSAGDYQTDKVLIEDFCTQALSYQEAQFQKPFLKPFLENLVFYRNRLFNAEYFGQIRPINSPNRVSYSIGKQHYIISLGQHPFLELFQSKNPKVLTNLRKALQNKNILIEKALKSKNISECSSILQNQRFDTVLFFKQIKLYNEINLPLQKYFGDLVKKQVQAFISKSNTVYEYLHASDVNVIQQILKSPQTGSVLIIAHASSEGILTDSLGQIIPESLFRSANPNLGLVGIFSCYPEAVERRYFSQILGSNNFEINNPHFSVALPKNTETGANLGKVPAVGLPNFLVQYQNILNRLELNLENNIIDNHIQDTCSVSIRNVQVTSGSLGFFVNRQWVGSIHDYYDLPKAEASWNFSFPCELLKSKGNIVFAENISIYGDVGLESPALIDINIWNSQRKLLEKISQKIYFQSPHKFRSIKIHFNNQSN